MINGHLFHGAHVAGADKAHLYCAQHRPFFNCDMVGTFNIRLQKPFEDEALPTLRKGPGDEGRVWYHFLHLISERDTAYGWSFHWEGSHQKKTVLEVVTRQPLPESFKRGAITVEVLTPWSCSQIAEWAKDQYWFQTFPWSPKKKADSELVWRAIRDRCAWENRTVLDIGTHYGYHALRAAEAGASVVGFEPEDPSRENAITIDRFIVQEGVQYEAADPGGSFGVILYLSVHHQIDPSYDALAEKVQTLRKRCRDLFIELILPSSYPEFGCGRSDEQLDAVVGGETLLTYQHRVRGNRRIYHVKGDHR